MTHAKRALTIVFLSALLLSLAACASGEPVALKADFGSDPRASGWSCGTYQSDEGEDMDGEADWYADRPGRDGLCLEVKQGFWRSPEVAVTSLQYYEISYQYKCAGTSYWTALFSDGDGRTLPGDVDSSVESSPEWTVARVYFRTAAHATRASVRFRNSSTLPLCVDNVIVKPIARKDVAALADAVYATMPPVTYAAPPGRHEFLAQTMERLKAGEALTIVLLGDSIMNDTGNSGLDVLLERQFPGSSIKLINSVRGSTGCQYYKLRNRVQSYVLDYQPDLVIIGGISHGGDVDAIRDVIHQVRAKATAEILVLTGAIPRNRWDGGFAGRLQAMAAEEKVAYFDIGAAWQEYVKQTDRPSSWLQRDYIHANDRGKQVLARLMLKYLGESSSGRSEQ